MESFVDGRSSGKFIDSPDLSKSDSGQHRWEQSPFETMSVSALNRENQEDRSFGAPLQDSWHQHLHEKFRTIRNSGDTLAIHCPGNTWSRSSVRGHERFSTKWSANGANNNSASRVLFR